MELVQLDRQKLDSLKAAIALMYVEETGAFAATYFPVQVVYINRDTWHILNPHTYEAMKAARPTDETFSCLLVSIPAEDEIGAAIALNGGIEGLLAAAPANQEASERLAKYCLSVYNSPQREKLFGLGADADYWLDFFDWLDGKDTPTPTETNSNAGARIGASFPKHLQTAVQYDEFPTLDLALQASSNDIQAVQWSTWGGQARGAVAEAVHFYTDDERFTAVINDPAKVAASGARVAIEPNFSANEFTAAALGIADIWRKRKINYDFQQAGLKTIVDLNVPRNLLHMALCGVPRGWVSYANRAYAVDYDHLIEAYELAQAHAGQDDILYIVFGSEGVQALCQQYGWIFVNVRESYGKKAR